MSGKKKSALPTQIEEGESPFPKRIFVDMNDFIVDPDPEEDHDADVDATQIEPQEGHYAVYAYIGEYKVEPPPPAPPPVKTKIIFKGAKK